MPKNKQGMDRQKLRSFTNFYVKLIFLSLCLLILGSCTWGLSEITAKTFLNSISPPLNPAISLIEDDFVMSSLTQTPDISWDISYTSDLQANGFTVELSIGTTPSATDTVLWTDVTGLSSWNSATVSLALGSQYYTNLRIKNSGGEIVSVLSSNGWITTTEVTSLPRYSIAQQWNSYQVAAPEAACPGEAKTNKRPFRS